MYKLTMNLSNKYDIVIENGILDKAQEYIEQIYSQKNVYIVTDERVAEIYLERLTANLSKFNVKSVIIKGYEESKSLAGYEEVVNKLLALGICRNELLIALGGGVIGDLVGFVAATLFRGIGFIQIPTTLLAQVDSSIGGKTGIDFQNHKNILGCFKQPSLVLIDPNVLKTLPVCELKSGYGEMIKHALIGSLKLWDLLINGDEITEEVIYENLLVKQRCVEADEYDNFERMKLNFGHTFGHVIELKDNLLHGEAVLSGMLCSLDFGSHLKLTSEDIKQDILKLYQRYNLKYVVYNYRELASEIHYDKKNLAGVVNFVLLRKIGDAIIYPVKEENLHESFN